MRRFLFFGIVAIFCFPSSGFSAQPGPDELIKGMTLIRTSARYSYDSPAAETALVQMRFSTGINWVVIQPVWWMTDTGKSEIFWLPDSSPSDREISHIIRLARNLGIRVFLKPQLRCRSGVSPLFHNPPDTLWFTAYRRFILHYAEIGLRTGCELFAIGTGLDRTTDETWERAEWHRTIAQVRKVFRKASQPPALTYGADWRTWRQIPFWQSLDYIGINAFFPLTADEPPYPPSEFPPGSVDGLAWFWKHKYLPEIENFLSGLDQPRPVLFTEIGYRSIDRCYLQPENDTQSGNYDPVAQRNSYIAAYHALAGRPWFAGWCFYAWQTDTGDGGAGNTGYTPHNKKAQEVMRKFNATLATHRGFCFPTTYDSTYFYSRTFPALDSLAGIGANWVAVNSRWLMRDTGPGWSYLKPLFGESPADSSIRLVIDYAHARGLNVALSCYLACSTRTWCGRHNPQSDTAWFWAESVYATHCARLAEEKGVEMLTIGLEINQTLDSPEEAQLWRTKVIPAVRACYSGPLAYGASWSPVNDYFWDGIDICGIHPYFPLVETTAYPGRYPDDTAITQQPDLEQIRRRSPRSWERLRIPQLNELYQRIHRPILFTEIGYRSLDSAALGTPDTSHAWHSVRHRLTTRRLNAVCFPVDTMNGYIAGDSGIILKTTDSGRNWNLCPSGTNRTVYALSFPARDTGYAVGESGVILKTVDGFARIQPLWTGTNTTLYSVCFPADTRTGYVVGANGTILKTTDGGKSWERKFCLLPSGETLQLQLRAIDFAGRQTGYIAGEQGTILKTTDGGNSWHRLDCPVTVRLNAVDLLTPDTGFIVGDQSTLLWTTDGGASWQVERFRTGSWDLLSVSVPEYDSARFACGTGGLILRAGSAWQFNGSVQHSNVYLPLRSIQIRLVNRQGYYDLVGFAVGDSGTILKTSTGGRMRVDFNEQANCYEAAFRAFWRNPEQIEPLPWFYGFHFWKWETDPAPMDIEHELVIDDYTPQGKRAAQIVRHWFSR
ncbi:MAG: YCF48-related protein [candidate division WOR-3 bacterium]